MATYNNPQLISNRIPVNPPLSAAGDRYQFLNLRDAEPNLGVAVGTASATYLATSNTVGDRGFTSNSTLVISNDSVGINNDNPQYKLDVSGDINITGEFRKNGEIVSVSGFSGFSGQSGWSGYSGYSGISGYTGYSGESGISGYTGYSGESGISGYSGFTGESGISGYSGFTGESGI